MSKLFGWLGLTLGGWLGWWIGAPVSIGVALLLSVVGSGFGLYIGRRIAHDYF